MFSNSSRTHLTRCVLLLLKEKKRQNGAAKAAAAADDDEDYRNSLAAHWPGMLFPNSRGYCLEKAMAA